MHSAKLHCNGKRFRFLRKCVAFRQGCRKGIASAISTTLRIILTAPVSKGDGLFCGFCFAIFCIFYRCLNLRRQKCCDIIKVCRHFPACSRKGHPSCFLVYVFFLIDPFPCSDDSGSFAFFLILLFGFSLAVIQSCIFCPAYRTVCMDIVSCTPFAAATFCFLFFLFFLFLIGFCLFLTCALTQIGSLFPAHRAVRAKMLFCTQLTTGTRCLILFRYRVVPRLGSTIRRTRSLYLLCCIGCLYLFLCCTGCLYLFLCCTGCLHLFLCCTGCLYLFLCCTGCLHPFLCCTGCDNRIFLVLLYLEHILFL